MPTEHSHFGIYAAIADDHGKRILLIRKMRGPYTGLLDLPGGSPEEGETPEETLVREVREETGCSVVDYRQRGNVEAEYAYTLNGEAHLLHHKGVLFTCRIEGGAREDGDGEDAGGCVWMETGTIKASAVTPCVLEAVKVLKAG